MKAILLIALLALTSVSAKIGECTGTDITNNMWNYVYSSQTFCFDNKCHAEWTNLVTDSQVADNNYGITPATADQVLTLTVSLGLTNTFTSDCLETKVYKKDADSEANLVAQTDASTVQNIVFTYSEDNIKSTDYCALVEGETNIYNCAVVVQYFYKDVPAVVINKTFSVQVTIEDSNAMTAVLGEQFNVSKEDPQVEPIFELPSNINLNQDLIGTVAEPIVPKKKKSAVFSLYSTVPLAYKETHVLDDGSDDKTKKPKGVIREIGTDFVYPLDVNIAEKIDEVDVGADKVPGFKLSLKSNYVGKFRARTTVYLKKKPEPEPTPGAGRFLNEVAAEKTKAVIQEFDVEFQKEDPVPEPEPEEPKPEIKTVTEEEVDETAVTVLIIVLVIVTIAAVIGGVCAVNKINALKSESKYADKGETGGANDKVNVNVQ